jgi:hypothetical protein
LQPRATKNMSFATHTQLENMPFTTHTQQECAVSGSMRERKTPCRNRHHEPTPQSPQKTSQHAYASGQQQHIHTQTTKKSEYKSTSTKYESPSSQLKLIKYQA